MSIDADAVAEGRAHVRFGTRQNTKLYSLHGCIEGQPSLGDVCLQGNTNITQLCMEVCRNLRCRVPANLFRRSQVNPGRLNLRNMHVFNPRGTMNSTEWRIAGEPKWYFGVQDEALDNFAFTVLGPV